MFKMDPFCHNQNCGTYHRNKPYPSNQDWWWEFLDLGLLPLLDQDNSTTFQGTMNSKVYQEILEQNIMPSVKKLKLG